MTAIWHQAELIGQRQETQGTNRFWFKILSDDIIEYAAGQFFTFDLPLGEKRIERWRSYSIANYCDRSNIFELCISYKKNGLASNYFFEEINKGDRIKFKGPEGTFIIPNDLNKPIVMLATGTGIVPFRAMLQQINKDKLAANIHLIFGTRKEKDILYLEELEDFAHFIDGLKISICLSRETKLPKSTNNISYHQGYIHPIYLQEKKAIVKDTVFMICGWTTMIDEALANLVNTMKVDRKQIKFELFG
ncbi:MAG: FAD-dependent oxidoreductase [Saprospiraceae bacterium]